VTLQPGAAAFRCRATKAALWRLTRISVESLLMPEQSENTNEQPRLDELISLSQAAEFSGLTQPHLALLIRQGKLWGKKIGRNWVTTEIAVREYMAQEHKPGPKPRG